MPLLRDYAGARSGGMLPFAERDPAVDEVVDDDGALRPAWRRLLARSGELELAALRRTGRDIERLLADEGVVYAPPGEDARSWRLDPVPVVLDVREWAELEKGLAQRAELVNAIATDLYGEQAIVREGLVPASVVYGHRGFIRSMARPGHLAGAGLVLVAADLVRGGSGEWMVAADRTQAPSGLGFAMENRRVLSRVLPDWYGTAGLHRLTPYVQAFRSALLAAAPAGVERPRVVVLSPGPRSETVYDQAAIASSLGFPLVEAVDLTVRDGALWLRSLDRPGRVDVVLRRVDELWSDPLELRGDSRLGVPGLAEAARRGTVRLVNALGSGAAENPGLLPFLSRLSERLLDESLRLPSVPTYWAGDAASRQLILDRLDELRVLPLGAQGVPEEPERLRALIAAEPYRWAAQERTAGSTVPVLGEAGLEPQALRLRTFTIRHGAAYRPLAGGLATVGAPGGGQVSKDVWVLKDDPADADQGFGELARPSSPLVPAAVTSHGLDDMFWLGRYVVRLEDTLRLVAQGYALAADHRDRPTSAGGVALAAIRDTLGSLMPPGHAELDLDLRTGVADAARSGSVAQSIQRIAGLVQSLRDQLSPDVYRSLAALQRSLVDVRRAASGWQVAERAGRMLDDALALQGISANMVRDPAWRAHEIGRALERALQLSALLRPLTAELGGPDAEHETLSALLQAAESAVTHRRRYRGDVGIASVLDLLVLDAENPRSLRFSAGLLRDHLSTLPSSSGSSRPERLVDDVIAELEGADLPRLLAVEGGARPALRDLLASTTRRLRVVAEGIEAVHVPAVRAQRPLQLSVVIEEP